MLTLKEAITYAEVNPKACRRLVVWDWSGLGTGAAEENAARECLQQWQWEMTPGPEEPGYPKILWFELGGTALGLLQIKALVQWNDSGRLHRHVRLFTEVLRRKAGYDGPSPIIDHVRLRHGGSGERRWRLAQ